MKLSKLLKVVLATTLTLSASTASAAFVYSYTGNGFDFFGTRDGSALNEFTNSNSVTFQFETASKPLDTTATFSFNTGWQWQVGDGIHTHNSNDTSYTGNYGVFSFDTQGNISDWIFTVESTNTNWQVASNSKPNMQFQISYVPNLQLQNVSGDFSLVNLADMSHSYYAGFSSKLGSWDVAEGSLNLHQNPLPPPISPPSTVPLPAAAPLMLSGLGVLGFAARRRKAKVEAV